MSGFVTMTDRQRPVTVSVQLDSDQRTASASWFTWNEVMFDSFQAGNLKRIDLGVYFNLKSAVVKQIDRFVDKRFYMKRTLEFDLRTFACEHIGLSRQYDVFDLKRRLTPALRELEAIGFLEPRTPGERFQKIASGRWTIILQKPETAPKHRESRIEQELTRGGVNCRVAGELAAQFSEERIEEKLRLHDALLSTRDRRISRNPAGFLTAAIRHDYQSPPPEKPRLAVWAQNSREGERSRSSRISEMTQSTADTSAQTNFMNDWNALSLEERTRIERDALQQASRFHRDTMKRLEASGNSLSSEIRLQIVRDFWTKNHGKL